MSNGVSMATVKINLTDLVRLVFEEPIEWLAGNPSSSTPVSWITTNIDQITPGDIYLLASSQAKIAVIKDAHKRGAVGIIILGEMSTQLDLSSAAIPVLSLPNYEDIRLAERQLLSAILRQRGAIAEREVKIFTQLSQIAAEGGGLSGLANLMGSISGRGVLVQDKRGHILAAQPSSVLTSIWPDVLDQLEQRSSLPSSLMDRKQAGQHPQMITQGVPGGLERLIGTITVSRVVRGYISLIGIIGEMDTLDQVVLEQGALVGAIEMSRHKAVRETEKRLKGSLLTALLQENMVSRDARLWAQSMGFDLEMAHTALRFSWDGANMPSRRRLETLVNGEVARMGIKVIVNMMAAEVTCICQTKSDKGRPEQALNLAANILAQGYDEYPDTSIRCGVGTPAGDLSEWRDSFRQAGQALEMARRLEESRPLYFPDLSVYRLLMQIEHNPEMMAFQEETIGPLLDYEGGKDLIQTLETYFNHKGNLSQTAEALYIHRNTLLYRMDRIKDILELDMDNSSSRLAVQLSLHIYRMVGRKQTP